MRIACVGGGPGGTFFASLIKQMNPNWEVTVFERNRSDDTFGFGVVFSDSTLANLSQSDSVLKERLSDIGQHWDTIEVRIKGSVSQCGGNGMAAIGRKDLLQLLYQRADEVGVMMRFSTPVEMFESLDQFDLVVCSDGANSMLRSFHAGEFRPTIDVARAKFIWFGTTYRFNGLTFLFRQSADGIFAVHGYPIDDSRGTFIVETDEETWKRAGMDGFDPNTPPGVSDEFSKSYLEELFSREIDGHQLLVNNSRWGNFRTIKNESWHYKNFVLIGDSAHTAHFSVGSGTKMALEDASALAAAFEGYRGDLDQTLQTYEDSRRPGVDHIQGSAKPSLRWWENFGAFYQRLSPEQFSLHFFTRAITLGRLSHRDQAFVEDSLEWWKSNHGESPLETQFDLSGLVILSRMVEVIYDENGSCWATFRSSNGFKSIKLVTNWGESILKDCGVIVTISQDQDGFEKAAAEIEDIAKKDPVVIAVAGGDHSDRRSLGEMCKLIHRIPTLIVEDQTDRDLGETLILSGRTDFVGWCR